jgi:hypothetical protein
MRGKFFPAPVFAALAALAACGGGGGDDSAGAAIAAGVPNTDIFLLSVKDIDDSPDPANLRNLTARPGYDNQPAFVPGRQALLFSSIVDGRQADIFEYDFGEELLTQLTDTEESEYSPTPLGPDGDYSVVRVEQDGAQRLWEFSRTGREPRLLLPQWRNVGYHEWIDSRRVLAFLVGEPSQLAVIDIGSGIAEVLATGIGRSIHYLPESDSISFLDIIEADRPVMVSYSLGNRERIEIMEPRPDAQDYIFTSDDAILMAEEKVIYVATGRRTRWNVWADLTDYLPGPISRLALSADERWVALVVTVAEGG